MVQKDSYLPAWSAQSSVCRIAILLGIKSNASHEQELTWPSMLSSCAAKSETTVLGEAGCLLASRFGRLMWSLAGAVKRASGSEASGPRGVSGPAAALAPLASHYILTSSLRLANKQELSRTMPTF